MVRAQSEILTLQQFLEQSETKPASEFIDGRVIQKNMPQGKHSKLQGELVFLLNTILKPNAIAMAFPELRCTFGGRSTVPDVAIFFGNEFPAMTTVRSLMLSNLLLIGRLRFFRPTRAKQKLQKIF
jgi:Uma2 family endonuclease